MAKAKLDPLAPVRGPLFTPRFIIALVMMVVGIAWMAYYYIAVRVDPTAFPVPDAGSPEVHGRPRQLELPDRLRR